MLFRSVSLYAFGRLGDGSTVPIEAEHPPLKPDGYCVYTLDRNALGDGVHDDLFDKDFDRLADAEKAFAEQCGKHPDCEENVYSMPDLQEGSAA